VYAKDLNSAINNYYNHRIYSCNNHYMFFNFRRENQNVTLIKVNKLLVLVLVLLLVIR